MGALDNEAMAENPNDVDAVGRTEATVNNADAVQIPEATVNDADAVQILEATVTDADTLRTPEATEVVEVQTQQEASTPVLEDPG